LFGLIIIVSVNDVNPEKGLPCTVIVIVPPVKLGDAVKSVRLYSSLSVLPI
jgi:hypothetical protein